MDRLAIFAPYLTSFLDTDTGTTVGRLSCLLITASQSVSNYRPEEGDTLTDRIGMADTRRCLAAAVVRLWFVESSFPGQRSPSYKACTRSGHLDTRLSEVACSWRPSTTSTTMPLAPRRLAGLHAERCELQACIASTTLHACSAGAVVFCG